MWRRRPEPTATLDDVVEVLQGIGRILMESDEKLERLADILKGEDDEETDA